MRIAMTIEGVTREGALLLIGTGNVGSVVADQHTPHTYTVYTRAVPATRVPEILRMAATPFQSDPSK